MTADAPPGQLTVEEASATQVHVSSGDASATKRRRVADRRRCPACGKSFRRTALARHRSRKHPETPILPIERLVSQPVIKTRATYCAMTCPDCRTVIPAGTPLASLVKTDLRRAPYAHLVCRAANGNGSASKGVPPLEPHQKGPPVLATLARAPPLYSLSPQAGDPPTSPATVGDALLSRRDLEDWGVRRIRAEGTKRIAIELEGDRAAEFVKRLVGEEYSDLVECSTCRDVLGVRLSVPRVDLSRHDTEAHADLWHKGRLLAEMRAIEERQRRGALTEGKP